MYKIIYVLKQYVGNYVDRSFIYILRKRRHLLLLVIIKKNIIINKHIFDMINISKFYIVLLYHYIRRVKNEQLITKIPVVY